MAFRIFPQQPMPLQTEFSQPKLLPLRLVGHVPGVGPVPVEHLASHFPAGTSFHVHGLQKPPGMPGLPKPAASPSPAKLSVKPLPEPQSFKPQAMAPKEPALPEPKLPNLKADLVPKAPLPQGPKPLPHRRTGAVLRGKL